MAHHPLLLKLFLLTTIVWTADAARNITIDDTDSSIAYIPPDGWDRTIDDPLNIGGSHMVTADSSSIATMNFIGTAVYFYSPLWPFRVTTAVSLDNAPPETLDLRDYNSAFQDQGPETVSSAVVWSVTGLEYAQHTLLISVAAGDNLAILDAVVYTVPEPGDTSSTSSPLATRTRIIDATSAPASSNKSTAPSAKKGLSIALGIVCTVFGVLVLGALVWWWRRRKRAREQKEQERLQALGSPSGTNESTPSMSDASREWELFSSPSTIPRRKQVPLASPGTSSSTSHHHTRRPLGSHTPSTPSPLNPATRRNKTLSTIREDSLPTSTILSRHVTRTSVEPLSEVGVLEDDRRTSSPSPPSFAHTDSVQDWRRG